MLMNQTIRTSVGADVSRTSPIDRPLVGFSVYISIIAPQVVGV